MSVEVIFEENIRLAYEVINNLDYVPKKVEMEDLEQVAHIALWKAILSYDEDSDFAMSTHCYRLIYTDVIDYLRNIQAVKRKDIPPTPGVSNIEEFESDLIGSFLVEEMKKHIPKNDLSIFIDKYVYKYTLAELSEKYSISEYDVRNRIRKSKCALKQKLKWGESCE